MDAIPLKKRKVDDFRPEYCILYGVCCTSNLDTNLTSSDTGRKQIYKAAEIRKDEVYERLQNVPLDSIVYHVSNDCYKKYTHKNFKPY